MGGTSAFSLFMQRFVLITIIYVIKIESRKASRRVPDSAQWAMLTFRGEGSFPGGKAPLPQQLFTSPRQAVSLDVRPAAEPRKSRYAGSTAVLRPEKVKLEVPFKA